MERKFQKVKFEKGGKLTLSFSNEVSERESIERQLQRLEETGTLEIVTDRYTFSMQKCETGYDLTFSKPVRLVVSETDGRAIEDMLRTSIS